MADHTFVGRQRELAQLDAFLETTVSGKGQVAFVTGDAGSDNTALVAEFARRAQIPDADLLVAFGTRNAQTGHGDPYLPFRDVLILLSGGTGSRLADTTPARENAGQVRAFLVRSGTA